jgi:hypothetical protein
MNNNTAIDMGIYYRIRKEIRSLYKNDVNNNGDLYCSVLEVRDKHRCVSSISIDTVAYCIFVDLDDSTSDTMRNKIIAELAEAIRSYINSNIDLISSDYEAYIDQVVNSSNYSFCDISVIGNSIKIIL